MSRYPYTDIWTGRHVTFERDVDGDLYLTNDIVGARLRISHDEARVLAGLLIREVGPSKGKRFAWPWRRTQRQVAGDKSVQVQYGVWPGDRR